MNEENLVVCAACPDDDESIDMVKSWVKEQGFTSATHRILKSNGTIIAEEKGNESKRN